MQPDPSETEADARQEFTDAIRLLHLEAGGPSTRTVARGVGGMSHTTVANVLNGRIPGWPIVRGIVRYLDGDTDHFQKLWTAAQLAGLADAAAEVSGDLALDLDAARLDEIAAALRALADVQLSVASLRVAGHLVYVTRHDWDGRTRYAINRIERDGNGDDDAA